MLTASIVLFMYAVLSGVVMAVGIFRGAKRWRPLALGHGLLAAAALVMALFVSMATRVPAIRYGVAVLCLAALGGVFLFGYHVLGKPRPWVVVVLHAMLAVGGVGCLVFAFLQ